MSVPLIRSVEHYVAEIASAPAFAEVPEGSYYFPARPDLIVLLKSNSTLVLDQTARVAVSTDTFGGQIYVLIDDTRAEGNCQFGDPTDGTVFSCDRVPLKIRAGTRVQFINREIALHEAA